MIHGEEIVSTSKESLEKFIRELHRKLYNNRICVKTMTLNIALLINNDLKEAAKSVFNPRDCMHISRNDGEMDTFSNLNKDTIIMINALLSMTENGYSQDDYDLMEDCKNYKD